MSKIEKIEELRELLRLGKISFEYTKNNQIKQRLEEN
jgi:hypothetical protein